MSNLEYLYGHTSQDTAKVVEGYPWGYRLRTTIRYWIESKKGHGQRFCHQTMNPKTGVWCAPKHGTYACIAVMMLNDQGHVTYEVLDNGSSEEKLNKFKNTHIGYLDSFQKEQFEYCLKLAEALKNIEDKFTIQNIHTLSEGEANA
jgi:hypothetical protein